MNENETKEITLQAQADREYAEAYIKDLNKLELIRWACSCENEHDLRLVIAFKRGIERVARKREQEARKMARAAKNQAKNNAPI